MSTRDQIRDTFFQECEDLLIGLQDGFSEMDQPRVDDETIHSVFRAVHSIKGGAGAFGFDALVTFAHQLENVLDVVRRGGLAVDADLMSVMWPASDMLSDHIESARGIGEIDPVKSDALVTRLDGLIAAAPATAGAGGESSETLNFEPVVFEPVALEMNSGPDPHASVPPDSEATQFLIHFSPDSAMYRHGNEAALLLRDLSGLGDIHVECDDSAMPDFAHIDPDESYLRWNIRLTTACNESRVLEVFEFVVADCALEITAIETSATGNTPVLPALPATSVGQKIPPIAPANASAVTNAPEARSPNKNAAKPTADDDCTASAGVPKELERRTPLSARTSTIRVDVGRVDRLINLMGELVINQAMLSQCVIEADLSPESGFSTGLEELKRLTREAQDGVMSIRTQQVKPLFQRMSRIVREVAAATGKPVQLKTSGELTEVDQTVIEKLADPLTHMIRNAVDHGLEDPDVRIAAGKAAEGTVLLAASHRSGRVLIEVIDDGGGIDRDRVRQIALDKGLIKPDDLLTPEDTDALLFKPGFSTVKEVSNLSGRGVGMDVVRTAVTMLGGRVAVASTPGKGSKFSVSLPLTLAVLDGMVVDVATQRAVIPITVIVETLRPRAEDIHVLGVSCLLAVRGGFVPIVDLGRALGFRQDAGDFCDCVLILTETDDGARFALAVDAIHDQRQVVIKGLEANYGKVPGIAAATILGSGQIALIIDPNDQMFTGSTRSADVRPILERTG